MQNAILERQKRQKTGMEAIFMIHVRNFSAREVACKHCGRENMAHSTILKAQTVRDYLDRPVYVYSGCRCPVHNAAVGGVPDSAHLITETKQCHALDLSLVPEGQVMTDYERFILYDALRWVGFVRLGVKKSFIHTDDDPEKPAPRMWLY